MGTDSTGVSVGLGGLLSVPMIPTKGANKRKNGKKQKILLHVSRSSVKNIDNVITRPFNNSVSLRLQHKSDNTPTDQYTNNWEPINDSDSAVKRGVTLEETSQHISSRWIVPFCKLIGL